MMGQAVRREDLRDLSAEIRMTWPCRLETETCMEARFERAAGLAARVAETTAR